MEIAIVSPVYLRLVIMLILAIIRSILYSYQAHFQAQAQQIKKIHPEKIPYISGNGTF